jgi:hypothetical protein
VASKGATETKQWLVGASADVPERGRLVVDAGDITIGIYRRPQKILKTERSTNLPRLAVALRFVPINFVAIVTQFFGSEISL